MITVTGMTRFFFFDIMQFAVSVVNKRTEGCFPICGQKQRTEDTIDNIIFGAIKEAFLQVFSTRPVTTVL